MRQEIWTSLSLVFLAILCNFGECMTIVKREIGTDASIDPVLQEVDIYESEADRDKRQAGIGIGKVTDPKSLVKSALVGFVFSPDKSLKRKPVSIATTKATTTTTEDVVVFEKNKPVSLEVPSRLFGSSFTLITKVSTAAGDYMINSALRLQRFLEIFRPVLRGIFGVKGIVIDATTDKPIFSDPNDNGI